MGLFSRLSRRRVPPPPPEGVIADLHAAGFPVKDISELKNSKTRYDAAIPVLLDWLPRADGFTQDLIVMALGRSWAKEALDPLLELFRAEPVPGDDRQELLRWQVGDSLSYLWTDRRFDDFAALAQDRRYGAARQMIVYGLWHFRRPEVVGILAGLTEDPDVDGHALYALSKTRSEQARPYLEKALTDDRDWVRSAARSGLARLDKARAATTTDNDPEERP